MSDSYMENFLLADSFDDNFDEILDEYEEEEEEFSHEPVGPFDLWCIDPISTAQRLAMFPEMQQLGPIRRREFCSPPIENKAVSRLIKESSEDAETKEVKTGWDKSDAVYCDQCNFCFRTSAILLKHRKMHETNSEITPPNFCCPFPVCDVRCDCQATINEHVRKAHNQHEVFYENFQFSTWTEFERWKELVEDSTHSKFIRRSGRNNLLGKNNRYSCYFTSSNKKSTTLGVRKRPSRKSEKTCTAHISVKSMPGQISVRACLTHVGHEATVHQLPLSLPIKREIATALVEGVKEEEIAKNMRETSTPDDRRYYIQMYEIRNIYNKLLKNQYAPRRIENVAEVRREKLGNSIRSEHKLWELLPETGDVPHFVAEEEVT